eukprot:TRINITY_DN3200_c0_g1_i1.p1 TRINITY_DN3200_c0_g1~~TRINITY_DN3200_c0_g1_i1.p1  ORF type:complete len:276 (+),score=36.74 TRINITY_DN3200_c0_g1_i1:58-828(+)
MAEEVKVEEIAIDTFPVRRRHRGCLRHKSEFPEQWFPLAELLAQPSPEQCTTAIASWLRLLPALLDLPQWEWGVQRQGIQSATLSIPGSRIRARREDGRIQTSAREVLDLLWDPDRRREWDPLAADRVVISESDPQTRIVRHTIRNPGSLLQPRDLILLCAWRQDTSGVITLVQKSIVPGSLCPKFSGYVRGRMTFSFTRIAPSGGACRVTTATHLDLRGWLPAAMQAPHPGPVLLPVLRRTATGAAEDVGGFEFV